VRAATTTEKKTKIDKCGQIEKKNKKSKSILAQSQKAKSKKSAKPKKRRFPNEKAGKLPTRRVAASSCSFKLFMLQLQWCAKGVVEREREKEKRLINARFLIRTHTFVAKIPTSRNSQ